MSLALRHRREELMDQPGLASDEHALALAGLSRINSLSRSSSIVWSGMAGLLLSDPSRRWRMLDIASGAGDVSCGVASIAQRRGSELEVLGIDVSETAIAYARDTAQRRGARNVAFERLDALTDDLPSGFDIVACSLFLHHLDEADAARLLGKMAEAAGELVLVNDLRRTTLGYAMAWLGCRVLSRSSIVQFDGPASVAGAFTASEALALAERSGLPGATISHHWPQRFLLKWSRTQ